MKTRIVYTKFWNDSYIQKLSPQEKLVFLFLLSNEHVNMCGAYELTPEEITFRTGVKGAQKVVEKFQSDGKIIYLENYVILINHLKYQNYSKGSERQQSAYEREISLLPEGVQQVVLDRESLTSSELVKNYILTIHKSVIINHKSKTLNKKREKKVSNKVEQGEVVTPDQVELDQVVKTYNQAFGKSTRSTKGFEKNFGYWREVHDLPVILDAIVNASHDAFWGDKLTLSTLFRRRNPNGEDVDYIQDLSERKQGGNIAIIS